jgi:hypothetical protein
MPQPRFQFDLRQLFVSTGLLCLAYWLAIIAPREQPAIRFVVFTTACWCAGWGVGVLIRRQAEYAAFAGIVGLLACAYAM